MLCLVQTLWRSLTNRINILSTRSLSFYPHQFNLIIATSRLFNLRIHRFRNRRCPRLEQTPSQRIHILPPALFLPGTQS